MTPERCASILLQKLNQQMEFFSRLCDLSAAQKQAVEEDKEEQLPLLLEDREKIMRQLLVLDKVQAAYRQYWQAHRVLFAPGVAAQIRNKFSELEQKLMSLTCADRELKSLVQEKMSLLRSQIGTARQSKRVVAAYGRPQLASRPRFVSKLSQ